MDGSHVDTNRATHGEGGCTEMVERYSARRQHAAGVAVQSAVAQLTLTDVT